MVELVDTKKFEEKVKFIKKVIEALKGIRVENLQSAEVYIDEDNLMYLNIIKKDGNKLIIKENEDMGKFYYIQFNDKELFIYDDVLLNIIDDVLYKEFNRLVKEIEEFNDRKKREIIKKYFSD